MKYAKIVGGVVKQIDCNPRAGFIEVVDDAVCGQLLNTETGETTNPSIVISLPEQVAIASNECRARIEVEWSLAGQSNVNLGIITGDEAIKCKAWIISCRDVYEGMKTRSDILDIDVTDDQYWPVYELFDVE